MLNTNRLSIYAIGKIKKSWIKDGINQYKKRMPDLRIKEIKIFNIVNLRINNNIIISLSEEGKQFNSIELTSLLLNFKNKKISFLIGDADGISSDIKEKSDFSFMSGLIPSASPIRKLILLFLNFKSKEVSSIDLNCFPSSLRLIIIL